MIYIGGFLRNMSSRLYCESEAYATVLKSSLVDIFLGFHSCDNELISMICRFNPFMTSSTLYYWVVQILSILNLSHISSKDLLVVLKRMLQKY